MAAGTRSYYFRARPGGAMMLKITHDPRLRRSEMHRIAGINTESGKITPSTGHDLTGQERQLIDEWLNRGHGLEDRAAKAVSEIGHIAHWAQFQASPEELNTAADELLWAMQDLRAVLVRKLAQAAEKK